MKVMAWLMKLRSYTNWIPTAWLIAYEETGVLPTG